MIPKGERLGGSLVHLGKWSDSLKKLGWEYNTTVPRNLWENRRDRLLLFLAPSGLGEKAERRGRGLQGDVSAENAEDLWLLSDLGQRC